MKKGSVVNSLIFFVYSELIAGGAGGLGQAGCAQKTDGKKDDKGGSIHG